MNRFKKIHLYVLVLMALVWQGCPIPKEEEVKAEEHPCEHCHDYSQNTFSGIPAGLAYQMLVNYKKNHADPYTPSGGGQLADARSVWFSLDSLKKFIYKLEQEVCDSKCQGINSKDLGLRFYFAEYPEANEWARLDGENDRASMDHKLAYQYLHTVVIAPTYYSNSTGMNVDFDPRFVVDNGKECKPATMQQTFQKLGLTFNPEAKDSTVVDLSGSLPAFMLSPDFKTTAKNKGSLIPPPPYQQGSPQSQTGASQGVSGNGAVMFDMMENSNVNY